MGLRINNNISAMNSHRNLQANDTQLSKSLEKLSSGLKINRAADGPASLVVSEQMRAQISGLNQAVQNSEIAVSMIQTSEGALNEVNSLLVNMRQLAVHAANEGANDGVMLAADQAEIENSLAGIDRISRDTQFGTKKLLDGSNGANGATTGQGLAFVEAGTGTVDSGDNGYDIVVTQTASKSNLQG
ncbi:MAG: flagellin, partial [bacterium]